MTEEQLAAILAALDAVRVNQRNIFAVLCVLGGFILAGFLVTVFFLILNKH